MALPVSPNSISADQIRKEFGPLSGAVSLGAYRLDIQQLNTDAGTEAYKTALGIAKIPLDDDIPTSGEIKFSHFRGKRLNLIVDFYNHATTSINTAQLTQDVIFTVYRQGTELRDAFVTFTAQDGSGHSFTISNNIGSDTEAQEVRTVRKNVTYNVVFTEPNTTTQNGLIASSDGLKSTASDTGSHSMIGNIQKLVAGTSKKAFGDRVGSANDRNDMQITLSEGVNHIFTSGTGTKINKNGDPVAGAIDGFGGEKDERTTRPLTYRLEEIIPTVDGLFLKNIRTRYEENSPDTTIVVGGFRSKPAAPAAGSKVIAFANQLFGSAKGSRNYVALRTGTWGTNTQLITIIGSSGSIYGAGGNGGGGGGIPGAAGQGTQGSSALGIEHPTTIINKGVIFGGRGGGGGGAGGYGKTFKDTQTGCGEGREESLRIGGGGGAGGRGLPGGTGGRANTQKGEYGETNSTTCKPFAYATNGTEGSKDSNGSAGQGGVSSAQKDLEEGQCKGCGEFAFSGGGGAIESVGGSGNYGQQGQGGQRGYSILISSSGSVESFSGNLEEVK